MKKIAVVGKYSNYILSKSDEEYENVGDPTVVTIRLASPNDNISRYQRMYEHFFMPDKLKKEEIFLTLSSCNIKDYDDTSPLFKFSQDGYLARDEFFKSIRELAPEIIDEIHECVLDANPSWAKEFEVIKEINERRIQSVMSLYTLYSTIQKFEPDAEVQITVKVRINEDEFMFNVPQES